VENNSDDFWSYETARGTLYIVARTFVSTIVGSLFFILIARLLPQVSDLGLINSLQILITFAALLANLGLSNATSRFMSYYIGLGKTPTARNFSILIFRIGLISSAMLSLALFLSARYLASILFHQPDYTYLIQLASIDVFFVSMMSFSIFILFSLQEFRNVSIILMLTSLIKYTASFAFLYLGMYIDGIIFGFIIGDVISLINFVYILRHQIIRPFNAIYHGMTSVFKYSMPLFGSSILSYLSTNVDFYLVLVLSNLSTAGVYSPAVFIATVLATIGGALDQTLLPYLSRVFGKHGIDSFKDISKFGSRYIFFIYFPIGFATLASVYPIIIGIFRQRYSASIFPSAILILGITLPSVGLLFNSILKSIGHTNIFLISTSIALAVQLLISISIIPFIGATAAAIARSAAYAIMFIIPAYKLRRIELLHYDSVALRKGLTGSIIMALIIFVLNNYFSAIYYLPSNLLVGFFAYLMYLRFTRAMCVLDFEILDKILGGKFKLPIATISKLMVR
jgi:O-antigen/teichoic acid export membrane protein